MKEVQEVGNSVPVTQKHGIDVKLIYGWAKETEHKAQASSEIFKENELEGIICLGAGSPIDTGKAIAVLVTNSGKVQDYEGDPHKTEGPTMPLIAIPTTACTGSEVTLFVITDRSRNFKQNIVSNKIVPSSLC